MRFKVTLLVLAFVMFSAAAATAAPEQDREVERLREQIHTLLRQADELRAAGKHDAAREHVQKAEQLERKLAEHLAPDRPREYSEAELKKILSGLEGGIGALEALGKNDLAEGVRRMAEHVRGKLEGQREEPLSQEREAAKQQLEIMRMARKAFLEKDQHDAAERIEQAIHALELSLAGRRDREADEIRKRAPGRADLAELMARAGRIYREFEMPDRAEKVEGLGRRFADQAEHREPQREPEERGNPRHQKARHTLEVLGLAKHGLLEAERRDLAEKVEHLMHAIELSLEGRRDEEAMRIINSAPKGENMIEILFFAADKWEGFGHEGKALAIRKLGREWQEAWSKERGAAGAEEAKRQAKVAELSAQLAELTEMMKHLQKELEEMRREMK